MMAFDRETLAPASPATPYIGVVGPGKAVPAALVDTAEEVGWRLADAGAVLVCGGLDGVMAAASRGAYEHGGRCVGLLPGDDRAAANSFLTVALTTGLGEMRNALVVRCSDALIAIGGSWGTLSEVALALRLNKPVVALDTWLVTQRHDLLSTVASPEQAVRLALELAGTSREY